MDRVNSVQSTLQSPEFRQNAVSVLTVVAPPAAIVVQQGKGKLDVHQLAVSLALYFSFFFYIPSVLHAYWLLNVRDAGFEAWFADKKKWTLDTWEKKGGIVKEKVDETTGKVKQSAEALRAYGEEKARFVKDKKNQVVKTATLTYDAIVETYADLRDAVESGRVRSWTTEKVNEVVQKTRSLVAGYPRVEAVLVYLEKRIPALVEFATQVYQTMKTKVLQWLESTEAAKEKVVANGKPILDKLNKSSPKQTNGGPKSPVSLNEYESGDEDSIVDRSQEL